MNYAIGIDLGGTRIKTVAVHAAGRPISELTLDFDPAESMDWAEKIRALVHKIQTKCGAAAACLGLAAPGQIGRAHV